jgi:hypothetical protein
MSEGPSGRSSRLSLWLSVNEPEKLQRAAAPCARAPAAGRSHAATPSAQSARRRSRGRSGLVESGAMGLVLREGGGPGAER